YTLLLAPVTIWAAFTAIGGPIFLITALALNIWFIKDAYLIWRRDDVQASGDGYRVERNFFKVSLLYLFLMFGALLAESALRPFGLGGW
ncbi:MAG: protoheme IX farnesyltransferase, partial [Halocynthiibacter sp.]